MSENGQKKAILFGQRDVGKGRAASASTLPTPKGDIKETCAYISDMATELQQLARDKNLPVIAYFLDMVRVEAQSILSLTEASSSS